MQDSAACIERRARALSLRSNPSCPPLSLRLPSLELLQAQLLSAQVNSLSISVARRRADSLREAMLSARVVRFARSRTSRRQPMVCRTSLARLRCRRLPAITEGWPKYTGSASTDRSIAGSRSSLLVAVFNRRCTDDDRERSRHRFCRGLRERG